MFNDNEVRLSFAAFNNGLTYDTIRPGTEYTVLLSQISDTNRANAYEMLKTRLRAWCNARYFHFYLGWSINNLDVSVYIAVQDKPIPGPPPEHPKSKFRGGLPGVRSHVGQGVPTFQHTIELDDAGIGVGDWMKGNYVNSEGNYYDDELDCQP